MACRCFSTKRKESDFNDFEEYFVACQCKCGSRLVVEENKMRFEIIGIDSRKATKLINKIKVDDYLIQDTTIQKCDFLFLYKPDDKAPNSFLFVELKGCDIEKAADQIESAITYLKNKRYLTNEIALGFIVSSRHPSNDGTFRKKQKALENKFKSNRFKLNKKNKRLSYNPKTDIIS